MVLLMQSHKCQMEGKDLWAALANIDYVFIARHMAEMHKLLFVSTSNVPCAYNATFYSVGLPI